MPWATPDYALYHTRDTLLSNVTSLVGSTSDLEQATLQRTGSSANASTSDSSEGAAAYSASFQVVTYTPPQNHERSADPLKLLISFGEHAREFISSEVGLRVLQFLADPELLAQHAVAHFTDAEMSQLRALLGCCVMLKVLPLENPNGRALVEGKGRLCERKNGRGVDINRNWEVDWGRKEADWSAFEEEPGAHAFSEPEAQLVREVAEGFAPHVWLTVHSGATMPLFSATALARSGMQGLFMPYDHKREVASAPHDRHTLQMLREVNARACNASCVVGSGGASVGYLAHGTATDYMYQELRVPVAMTWEIYGDDDANIRDCFRMFNPLTKDAYDATVQQWSVAVLQLVLLMAKHPAVAHLRLGEAVSQQTRSGADAAHTDVAGGDAQWSIRDVAQVLPAPPHRRGADAALGVTTAGVRAVRPLEVYQPMRNMLAAAVFFGVTVLVWCYARRYLSNARVRRRVDAGAKGKGQSKE